MTTARGEVSVLIVDDDSDICETFKDVLEDAGYTVAVALDGRSALEVLGSVRPRLILLDVNMPDMDGHAFLRAQRADVAIRDIPTVVMTAGKSNLALREDCLLAKPVGLRDLLDVVARHCGG
jgi:CheY-like chemotaxis protein